MTAALVTGVRGLLGRPLLANSGALVALRATNLLARLAVLFASARVTAPSQFGLVVFAMAVAEIGKVAADFGMDTLAIREYAADDPDDPGAHGRFAAALAAGKLAFGGLVYASLAAWFLWRGPREQAELGLIAGLTAVTALLITYALDWYQARLRIARVFAPVVAANVLLALAAVLAVPRLADLRLQVALFPALELASGLVLLVLLRREGLLAPPWVSFGRLPGVLAACLPIAVTNLVIMLYSRLDVLVLSSRMDSAAVGHYGIAFRLTEPVQIAAAAFALSVYSRFSGWFRDPAAAVRAPALRYLVATLGYGAAAALALGLLAPPVIRAWFPGYLPAVPVLRILAATLVFRSFNATLSGIVQGAGRFRLLTGIALWNLALVFALLTVFVPRFGAPGAALALLVGEGLNSLIQLALVARLVARHERTAGGAR